MNRMLRTVSNEDWPVSDAISVRRVRLQERISPRDLLDRLVTEVRAAQHASDIEIGWQPCDDCDDFYRLTAKIKLTELTLDQFFNGCSGYRAQYALSPEEGILYNRDTLQAIWPMIRAAYECKPLSDVSLELLERSLVAPHAKVWIANEKTVFNAALPDTINPPRWVSNNAALGRRAPLLAPYLLDVKGCFISPKVDEKLFIDPLKLDRGGDIFLRGFS